MIDLRSAVDFEVNISHLFTSARDFSVDHALSLTCRVLVFREKLSPPIKIRCSVTCKQATATFENRVTQKTLFSLIIRQINAVKPSLRFEKVILQMEMERKVINFAPGPAKLPAEVNVLFSRRAHHSFNLSSILGINCLIWPPYLV